MDTFRGCLLSVPSRRLLDHLARTEDDGTAVCVPDAVEQSAEELGGGFSKQFLPAIVNTSRDSK